MPPKSKIQKATTKSTTKNVATYSKIDKQAATNSKVNKKLASNSKVDKKPTREGVGTRASRRQEQIQQALNDSDTVPDYAPPIDIDELMAEAPASPALWDPDADMYDAPGLGLSDDSMDEAPSLSTVPGSRRKRTVGSGTKAKSTNSKIGKKVAMIGAGNRDSTRRRQRIEFTHSQGAFNEDLIQLHVPATKAKPAADSGSKSAPKKDDSSAIPTPAIPAPVLPTPAIPAPAIPTPAQKDQKLPYKSRWLCKDCTNGGFTYGDLRKHYGKSHPTLPMPPKDPSKTTTHSEAWPHVDVLDWLNNRIPTHPVTKDSATRYSAWINPVPGPAIAVPAQPFPESNVRAEPIPDRPIPFPDNEPAQPTEAQRLLQHVDRLQAPEPVQAAVPVPDAASPAPRSRRRVHFESPEAKSEPEPPRKVARKGSKAPVPARPPPIPVFTIPQLKNADNWRDEATRAVEENARLASENHRLGLQLEAARRHAEWNDWNFIMQGNENDAWEVVFENNISISEFGNREALLDAAFGKGGKRNEIREEEKQAKRLLDERCWQTARRQRQSEQEWEEEEKRVVDEGEEGEGGKYRSEREREEWDSVNDTLGLPHVYGKQEGEEMPAVRDFTRPIKGRDGWKCVVM
jgi:hypothetical protein